MKLFNVDFVPDRVVIDQMWVWTRVGGRHPHYRMSSSNVSGLFHLKTPEKMAQYLRELLSDPARRGFIKEGTLNIVYREKKEPLATMTYAGVGDFMGSTSSDTPLSPEDIKFTCSRIIFTGGGH